VYPPSKIFAKLVDKNAMKHQKGVPSPKNFYNHYIPSLPKLGKNLIDPPPRISNSVHLWTGNLVVFYHIDQMKTLSGAHWYLYSGACLMGSQLIGSLG
jgi:hypothetical protein